MTHTPKSDFGDSKTPDAGGRAILTDERLTSLLYVHAIDPILISDFTTGIIIDCNNAAVRYFGYGRDQLVGMAERLLHAPEECNGDFSPTLTIHRDEPARLLEARLVTATGEPRVASIKATVFELDGKECIMGVFRDITELKKNQDALNKRLIALTLPLDDTGGLEFEDIFDLEDVQGLQDAFTEATQVASIITRPDGTPITRPSNFCRLCMLIRATSKGKENCYRSDAVLGRLHVDGPQVRQCLSGGLWDAGATISVGGKHIANWLIGQVRDETQTDDTMAAYAQSIGLEAAPFLEAFHAVPSMSKRRFESIAQFLFALAGKLSSIAYQNIMQTRSLVEMKQVREKLLSSMQFLNDTTSMLDAVLEQSPIPMLLVDAKTMAIQVMNPACKGILGVETLESLSGENIFTLRKPWKLLSMDGQPFKEEEHPLYTALKGETISQMDVRVVRGDGTERRAELHVVPIFNDRPELIAGLVVLLDITSRQAAEPR